MAKFEIYKDANGGFRFRLRATNGQVVATGESYKSRAGALKGIESIKKNAGTAAVVDTTASSRTALDRQPPA